MSLDVMYSHWEQCREVNGESLVCMNCHQTKFSLTLVIFFIKKNIGFENNSYFKKFINFKFFCFSKEEVEEFLKYVSVKKEIEEYQSTILSVYIGK